MMSPEVQVRKNRWQESQRPLMMVRLPLHRERLLRVGHRLGLSLADMGYLVHMELEGLWQKEGPKPFLIEEKLGSPLVVVMGYMAIPSHLDRALPLGEQLTTWAQIASDPDVFNAVEWGNVAAKPVPEAFRSGQTFEFRIRVSPTIHEREGHHDAFILACRKAQAEGGPRVDRQEVYRGWLARELERGGGASLLACHLESFALTPVWRRTQGAERQGRTFRLPDATLQGMVQVGDPAAFAKLLQAGIGRQTAFGFGMLLLKRPL